MTHTLTMSILSFLFSFSILPSISLASVPSSKTFKYVNTGSYGDHFAEYSAVYRNISSISNGPFSLCFYFTKDANSFTLALLMGSTFWDEGKWVWEANRGKPVGENATLTFRPNGNLVLADGPRIVWATNTANKGVTGLNLLPNGNLVLHDSKGKFIWQSFDYPTDTLLVGQSLKRRGVNKLVSRASIGENINGAYSLVTEYQNIGMYYKGPNSPTPYLYYSVVSDNKGPFESVRFGIQPNTKEGYVYDLYLYLMNQGMESLVPMGNTNYNGTLSIVRLELDGNLRVYTFYEHPLTWQVTRSYFDRDQRSSETECQLPEKCGEFGLCSKNQCVACPSPSGLMGWSESCKAEKVTKCGANDFYYYKMEGVHHFMMKFWDGSGPMKKDECEKKCTNDCKCLGYFYKPATSMCWIAYDLKTLTKVDNPEDVAYIKAPKK